MASVEFLTNRVAGKEKELEQLNKKLERILKAQSTNWEVNPYYYRESDLKYVNRDIEACKAALEDYKKKLAHEVEKSNSRDVKAILDFLEIWKKKVTDYYKASLDRYVQARTEYYAKDHEYCNWFNSRARIEADPEEIKAKAKENKKIREAFYSSWNWFTPYVESGDKLNEEKLKKDLDNEANNKYDFIIERTNEIVGTITDATGLRIGNDGDLNGLIIGDRGTAKVQTIGAGGWNIQCYHFRTLIHKVA